MKAQLEVDSGGTRLNWAFSAAPLVQYAAICPDRRGYWGDYDDLQIESVDASGMTTFIRTHTDTDTGQCSDRYNFWSSPVHVSAQTFQ